jgi:TonB family protein
MNVHMKTALIALLAMASIMFVAQTGNEGLSATLEQRYKDQILILRHPQSNNSQTYEDSGSPSSPGEEGPWAIYGGLKVGTISVGPSELRIVGERFGFIDPCELKPVPVSLQEKKPLTVQVRLAKPPASVENIDVVIQHVFAVNVEALMESVPGFWRSCLERRLKQASGEVKPAAAHADQEKLDRKVRPPKPIYTPEPAYNKIAKRLNLQGTVVLSAVVGVDGLVHNAEIIKPVGLGLDEQAVAIVKKWRFRPGELDGKAVPVEMKLEIDFKLY